MSSTLAKEERLVIADPQTYGGLLITTPHERRAQFQIGAKNLFILLVGAKRDPGRLS
jgi:selenophosphate synthase